jgi:hypothetical protein
MDTSFSDTWDLRCSFQIRDDVSYYVKQYSKLLFQVSALSEANSMLRVSLLAFPVTTGQFYSFPEDSCTIQMQYLDMLKSSRKDREQFCYMWALARTTHVCCSLLHVDVVCEQLARYTRTSKQGSLRSGTCKGNVATRALWYGCVHCLLPASR